MTPQGVIVSGDICMKKLSSTKTAGIDAPMFWTHGMTTQYMDSFLLSPGYTGDDCCSLNRSNKDIYRQVNLLCYHFGHFILINTFTATMMMAHSPSCLGSTPYHLTIILAACGLTISANLITEPYLGVKDSRKETSLLNMDLNLPHALP